MGLCCIFDELAFLNYMYMACPLCLINERLLCQALIARHREYTLIYNAECDSLNPKSGETVCSLMLAFFLPSNCIEKLSSVCCCWRLQGE